MSFRLKTMLGVAVIASLLIATLVFTGFSWLDLSARGQLATNAERSARLILLAAREKVASGELGAVDRLLADSMVDSELLAVRLLGADGSTISVGGDEGAFADEAATIHAIRLDDPSGISEVQLVESPEMMTRLHREARSAVIALSVVEIVLVALFSALLGTWLTRQLNRLREASLRVEREGPGYRIPSGGDDEVGQAISAFNTMSTHLAESYGELQNALAESRQLTERIAESEMRKRELIDTALDGIITIDQDGRVVDYNPSAEQIFGFSPEEVMGQPLDQFIVPEGFRERHLLGVERLRSGEPGRVLGQRMELPAQRKDGGEVPLEITITATSIGEQRFFTAFMRDISERRRAQSVLEQTARRAEEANEAKSRFLASMSHEIRTPLNAILNMLELVLETELREDQRTYAATASDAARALLSIVNSVLDFSKIEAGRMELSLEPCDPEEVVAGISNLLAARAHAKGIHLTLYVDPATPAEIDTDPGFVRQIVLNLVGNAIKFTEIGGVRVSLEPARDQNGREQLLFQISDTGIGIAEEQQEALFEEFVQADGGDTRRYGGTGLGLAISRRLAHILGGEIGVESQPEHGSRFWLSLPLSGEATRSKAREEAVAALAGARFDVIVDSSMLGDDLARQLEAFDFPVRRQRPDPGALASDSCGELRVKPRDGAARVIKLTPVGARIATPSPGATMPRLTIPAVPTVMLRKLVGILNSSDEAAGQVPKAEQPVAVSSQPILLAEDSAANQMVATTILGKAGYRVDVAENGLRAVAAVNSKNYGLVLMDLAMPEMDGLEATRCIRALPGRRGRIPIVAMTANAFTEDRQRCLDAGMDDYLSKPVVRATLLETVARWLSGSPVPAPAKVEEKPKEASPLLDDAVLAELESDVSKEMMPGLVATFTTEAERRLRAIAEAADSGEVARAGEEAHALKGSAGTFGAPALRELAFIAEKAGRGGDAAALGEVAPKLSEVGRDTVSAMRKRYGESAV